MDIIRWITSHKDFIPLNLKKVLANDIMSINPICIHKKGFFFFNY